MLFTLEHDVCLALPRPMLFSFGLLETFNFASLQVSGDGHQNDTAVAVPRQPEDTAQTRSMLQNGSRASRRHIPPDVFVANTP